MHRLTTHLIVLAACLIATPRHAQPLIDQVPAGALVYVGWAGADASQEAYLQSTLKAVVDEMQPEKIAATFDQAMRAMSTAVDEPEFDEVMGVMLPLMEASWRSPVAAYVLAPSQTPDPNQGPGMVVMWQPNVDDRPALLEALRSMVAEINEPNLKLTATETQLTLEFNAPAIAVEGAAGLLTGRGGAGLAESEGFATVMQGLGEPGLITTYIDLPALIALGRDAMEEADAESEVFAVLDGLKLEGFGPTGYSASFDSKDFAGRIFLSAPAPRTGLAAMLDAPTLDDKHLALVPRDAVSLTAGTFDVGKLIDLLRESAQALGPDVADQFEQALAQGSGMVGVNLEERLLRGLGPAWLAYVSPATMGPSMMGTTIINPLTDPEGVDMALRSIEAIGNALIAQQMQDKDVHIRFHTVQYGEVVLHQLGFPLITPTWAVHDGKLIIGLYPQTVLAAAAGVGDGGSILDNDAFTKSRVKADGGRATGISFLDLPTLAPGGYANLIMFESLATGGTSMMTGLQIPSFLPPLSRLMPHIRPIGGTAWVDDAGFFATGRSPFPGASLLNMQGSGGATTIAPMMIGILMPALGAARRTARQMTDNTQARGIHQAMYTHVQSEPQPQGSGDIPLTDDIGDLIKGSMITPEYTISPESGTAIPVDIHTWSVEEQADWVRLNSDYIIVPGLKEDFDTSKIALFLRPNIYNEPGEVGAGSVVSNDNSTVFDLYYNLEQQLIEQTGMTMDQLIARQEALAGPDTP